MNKTILSHIKISAPLSLIILGAFCLGDSFETELKSLSMNSLFFIYLIIGIAYGIFLFVFAINISFLFIKKLITTYWN